MARIVPDRFHPVSETSSLVSAEQRLHALLTRHLDDSWQIVHGATIRAGGDSGRIEFAALHRTRGVALIGLLADDDEADPDAAVAAMRAMLRDIGFERRFPGYLPIVALALTPPEVGRTADLVDRAFAEAAPAGVPDPAWAEWLAAQLVGGGGGGGGASAAAADAVAAPRPALSVPSLRPPSRDDAWRITAEPGDTAVAETPPHVQLVIEDGQIDRRRPSQPSFLLPGMALAACVVAGVLAGMAVMSHGNGPARHDDAAAPAAPAAGVIPVPLGRD